MDKKFKQIYYLMMDTGEENLLFGNQPNHRAQQKKRQKNGY